MRWLRRLYAMVCPVARAGLRGERAASEHLRRKHYRILAANFRSRLGEIDILCEAPDRRTIVVVEVKARQVRAGNAAGPLPETHVNDAKRGKLSALAGQMVRRHGLDHRPVRFDVIGVDLPESGPPVVRHHVAAFESRY